MPSLFIFTSGDIFLGFVPPVVAHIPVRMYLQGSALSGGHDDFTCFGCFTLTLALLSLKIGAYIEH